jgi:pyruvate dehydrogenase phosphatase
VKAALKEAAKKREIRLSDLQKIEQGVRRHFHDDITVIVVYLNPKLIDNSCLWSSPLSIRDGRHANS